MKNDNLINALIDARMEIDHIVQDQENNFIHNKYASLKATLDTVIPAYAKHGILIQQHSHDTSDGATVETVFIGHGERLSSGKVFIKAPKSDPHGFGSAISYAKRYSLQLACSIATKEEDDDGEKAMQRNSFKLTLGGKELVSTPSTLAFLKHCRTYLGDIEKDDAKKIFKESKDDIQKALAGSKDADNRKAFTQLIELYE